MVSVLFLFLLYSFSLVSVTLLLVTSTYQPVFFSINNRASVFDRVPEIFQKFKYNMLFLIVLKLSPVYTSLARRILVQGCLAFPRMCPSTSMATLSLSHSRHARTRSVHVPPRFARLAMMQGGSLSTFTGESS